MKTTTILSTTNTIKSSKLIIIMEIIRVKIRRSFRAVRAKRAGKIRVAGVKASRVRAVLAAAGAGVLVTKKTEAKTQDIISIKLGKL